MQDTPPIIIESQDWRAIPAELRDGLSQRPLTKKQLRVWMLVLQARQIPCRSESNGSQYQLLVPVARYREACEELRRFEEENRHWPPPPPAERPQQENTASTLWVLIAIGIFHIVAQKRFTLFGSGSVDWYAIGNAHVAKIFDGEWWRLATSLTLHSGGLHLTGNLIIGGLFIVRLCRDLGSGFAWTLILASGLFGNLLNALVQSSGHRSIGASTAVFGAVGLLAAINMLRYRDNLRHRWPLPVAAALGLLALLGAGGENTDIGAHLFGFLVGFSAGLPVGLQNGTKEAELLSSKFLNRGLALACLLFMLTCWWAALASSQ